MKTPITRIYNVKALDPETNQIVHCDVHSLIPCKSGIFGKMTHCNYNVFRAYGETQWKTNISGSTRFSMMSDGLTNNEIDVLLSEGKL